MAFVKKAWKDRLVEFAGRRQIKRVSGDVDGTMVVDVTRAEGAVSQVGDTFSAANMNDLEQRIENEFNSVNNGANSLNNSVNLLNNDISSLNNNVNSISNTFVSNMYVGNDGKLHKVQGGADTVLPFSTGSIQDILKKLVYHTWDIPQTTVPAKGTTTIATPTAQQVFGSGVYFMGISSITSPTINYASIGAISYSGYGTTSGYASITLKGQSNTDETSLYGQVRLMGYKP